MGLAEKYHAIVLLHLAAGFIFREIAVRPGKRPSAVPRNV